jgi:hypothetical protein
VQLILYALSHSQSAPDRQNRTGMKLAPRKVPSQNAPFV